jgi:Tfp pilus assembly protein FimT
MTNTELKNLANNMASLSEAMTIASKRIDSLATENRELKAKLVQAQSEALSYTEPKPNQRETTNKSSLESLVGVMSEEWQVSSEIVWAMVLDSAQRLRKPEYQGEF